jgi:hypothetical protein
MGNCEFSSYTGGHDPRRQGSLTIEVFMIFGRGGGAKEAVFTTDTDEKQAVLVERQFNVFHTLSTYVYSFGIILATAGSTIGKAMAMWSMCHGASVHFTCNLKQILDSITIHARLQDVTNRVCGLRDRLT